MGAVAAVVGGGDSTRVTTTVLVVAQVLPLPYDATASTTTLQLHYCSCY